MRLEALRKSVNNLIRNSLYPRQKMNSVSHQTKSQADPIRCLNRFRSYFMYSSATPTFSFFLSFFVDNEVIFIINLTNVWVV